MGKIRLNWKGDEVVRNVQKNVEDAYTEFGLKVEAEAKKGLQKGHGVITGTLRRSIHIAQPGYNWSSDNVPVKVRYKNKKPIMVSSGPERSGTGARAQTVGQKITLQIGSGMKYALAVHQGHHNFEGYHYLSNAIEKVKPQLKSILEKYKLKR